MMPVLLYKVPIAVDTVQRLGDGSRRCGRLLSRVQRHGVSDKRRRRQQVDAPSRTDNAAQRPRHEELVRDPLRSRKHQPLHAGQHLRIRVDKLIQSSLMSS